MKQLLMPLFVLSCGVWVFSQTAGSPSSSQATGTDNQTTVRGCLSGSSGNYTLTDKSGSTFQLAGDTSKLSEHVGHTVEITGAKSPSSPSSSGAAPSGGATSAQPTLNVTSMKHISETCSTSR